MISTAFPDIHETVEDIIAEGDNVVKRTTWRGTHQGEFLGIAPTGKQVSVSITLDTSFCLEALDAALAVAQPEIFNSDQGVQFTSADFTRRLHSAGIRMSWDGRGRALDNIFVERLWRSVKYEEVYVKDYQTVPEAVSSLKQYFHFYNHERLHQALDYQTPATVHWSKEAVYYGLR